jgi:hypothetical protein
VEEEMEDKPATDVDDEDLVPLPAVEDGDWLEERVVDEAEENLAAPAVEDRDGLDERVVDEKEEDGCAPLEEEGEEEEEDLAAPVEREEAVKVEERDLAPLPVLVNEGEGAVDEDVDVRMPLEDVEGPPGFAAADEERVGEREEEREDEDVLAPVDEEKEEEKEEAGLPVLVDPPTASAAVDEEELSCLRLGPGVPPLAASDGDGEEALLPPMAESVPVGAK